MAAPRRPFTISVGCRVIAGAQVGTVRYIGPAKFASGDWVGIELDTPDGKNDGTVNGDRYFTCPPNHGLFVKKVYCKRAPDAPSAIGSGGKGAGSDSDIPPSTSPDLPSDSEPVASVAVEPIAVVPEPVASDVVTSPQRAPALKRPPSIGGRPSVGGATPTASAAASRRVSQPTKLPPAPTLPSRRLTISEPPATTAPAPVVEPAPVPPPANDASAKELAALQQQIADLNDIVESLTLDKDQLSVEKELCEESQKHAELALEAANAKIKGLEEELAQAREALTTAESIASSTMSDSAESSNTLELSQQNAKLRAALIKFREVATAEKAELQAALASEHSAAALVPDLQAMNELLSAQVAELESDVASLKESVDASRAYDDMIERLTEKNLELSSQLQSSTSALEDMEQFKDLAEEMERQHVEYEEQLKGDVASLTIRLEALALENNEQKLIVQQKDQLLLRYKAALDAMKSSEATNLDAVSSADGMPSLPVVDFNSQYTILVAQHKTLSSQATAQSLQAVLSQQQHKEAVCALLLLSPLVPADVRPPELFSLTVTHIEESRSLSRGLKSWISGILFGPDRLEVELGGQHVATVQRYCAALVAIGRIQRFGDAAIAYLSTVPTSMQECTAACAILSKVAADSRAALSDLARSLIDQHSTENGCDLADIPQARIDTLYTAGSALKSSLTRLPSPPTLPEASGSATTDNVLNIAAAVPSSSLTFSTGISLDCAIGHLLYCTALTRSQLAQASLMVPDSGDELDSTQLSFLLSALAEVVSFPVVTDEDLSIFRSTQLLSPSFGKKIVAIISTCESRQCDDALTELKGVSSELKAIAPQALSRDTGDIPAWLQQAQGSSELLRAAVSTRNQLNQLTTEHNQKLKALDESVHALEESRTMVAAIGARLQQSTEKIARLKAKSKGLKAQLSSKSLSSASAEPTPIEPEKPTLPSSLPPLATSDTSSLSQVAAHDPTVDLPLRAALRAVMASAANARSSSLRQQVLCLGILPPIVTSNGNLIGPGGVAIHNCKGITSLLKRADETRCSALRCLLDSRKLGSDTSPQQRNAFVQITCSKLLEEVRLLKDDAEDYKRRMILV